jgi:NNP family nitrate/nitrite transporter-like MFS transporter
VVGVAMGIGKAAVFRFIPSYYPNEVGSVGGLVGALGALGGFFLTFLFAYAAQAFHVKQAAFGLVAVVTLVSLIWFHFSVLSMKRKALQAATMN